ncbi:MAG: dTDP-4-dehydrorhamnose reductase [Burkholderiaceae bacterium]
MRILITGTSGQVGWELARGICVLGEPLTPRRDALDLASADAVAAWLDEHRPDLIVNPAAYTAVDKAEEEQAAAYAINRDAPAAMAAWCATNDVALVHYSTDYVYPGHGEQPYDEADPTGPTNVYGQSKLAGEEAIRASGCTHLILRTSWVYGARGKNFLNTMLRLAETMPQLRVVSDQVGAPTPARLIAETTLAMLARRGMTTDALAPVTGTYHLVASGEVSWHGFAQAIMDARREITGKSSPEVRAITTAEFPTPASRPANSRMSVAKLEKAFDLRMPDWRESLAHVMAQRLEA